MPAGRWNNVVYLAEWHKTLFFDVNLMSFESYFVYDGIMCGYLDVQPTSFGRYECQMNVKKKLLILKIFLILDQYYFVKIVC